MTNFSNVERITTRHNANWLLSFLMLFSFDVNADKLMAIHSITFTKKAPQTLISLVFQHSDSDSSLKIDNVYYEEFDLNGDKKNEYFLYVAEPGWCGSHGCLIKIISRQGLEIKSLLDVTSYNRIYILYNKTKGYHDISFFPENEPQRHIWRWNGEKYN